MKIAQIRKIRIYVMVVMVFADRALLTVLTDMAPFTVARALTDGAGAARRPLAAITSRPPPAAFSSNPLTFVK